MDTFNPNLVNIYLEASSKDNLIKLQALNNMVNAKAYNYQTPHQDGKSWVVWFYADFVNHQYIDESQLDELLPITKALGELK